MSKINKSNLIITMAIMMIVGIGITSYLLNISEFWTLPGIPAFVWGIYEMNKERREEKIEVIK